MAQQTFGAVSSRTHYEEYYNDKGYLNFNELLNWDSDIDGIKLKINFHVNQSDIILMDTALKFLQQYMHLVSRTTPLNVTNI